MKCKKAKKVTFSKDYRFSRGTQLINHSIMSKVNKSRIIEKNSIMKPIIDDKEKNYRKNSIMSTYNVYYRLK